MTDYGKGAVLGGAVVLPSTSALGIFFADKMHPAILIGFFIINIVWLVILIAHISRYFINQKAA